MPNANRYVKKSQAADSKAKKAQAVRKDRKAKKERA